MLFFVWTLNLKNSRFILFSIFGFDFFPRSDRAVLCIRVILYMDDIGFIRCIQNIRLIGFVDCICFIHCIGFIRYIRYVVYIRYIGFVGYSCFVGFIRHIIKNQFDGPIVHPLRLSRRFHGCRR